MPNQPLICIFGPTATGKTGAAIALAKLIDAEIVSVDSVQVYRGMDIGSAKPTLDEQRQVPHHMIDCVDVDEPDFSVSSYFSMASACIRDIESRNKRVIAAGGSGLYADAMTKPLNFAVPADKAVRADWEAKYDKDPEMVRKALFDVDPPTAQRLHPNDKKRIVRALEVYSISGRPFSSFGNDFQNERALEPPFPSIRIGLTMDRTLLYERIDQRVDQMMEEGFLAEARDILGKGYSMQLPAMQSIGYAQLFSHLRGEIPLDEAIMLIKRDTRRFAKRQLTWFKRDAGLIWLDVTDHTGDSEWISRKIYEIVQQETE